MKYVVCVLLHITEGVIDRYLHKLRVFFCTMYVYKNLHFHVQLS